MTKSYNNEDYEKEHPTKHLSTDYPKEKCRTRLKEFIDE